MQNVPIEEHFYRQNIPKWYHFVEVIGVMFKRIRDLREDHDFTQQQLADHLFLTRSVYRRYEVGEREIPTWAVIQLADFYNTSTDYILGRTDRRDPIK